MNEPHDHTRTLDVPSAAGDSLDAGLAAAFGRAAQGPRSSLDASQRPVVLREAEGESGHVVKPSSDAMPPPSPGQPCPPSPPIQPAGLNRPRLSPAPPAPGRSLRPGGRGPRR